jgi:hypothetical protein
VCETGGCEGGGHGGVARCGMIPVREIMLKYVFWSVSNPDARTTRHGAE